MVATKLRALYQRKKGRDLYDLWLALTALELDPNEILEAFPAYHPEGLSGEQIIDNLRIKLKDKEFCNDVNAMIKASAPKYNPQVAGELIIEKLLLPLCQNPERIATC